MTNPALYLPHCRHRRLATSLMLLLSASAAAVDQNPAGAAVVDEPASDAQVNLLGLSLEELGNVRVTSVAKRPQRLADAAGSVYVITADDIRRSGAASLPEVLRLAPNLHVARTNAAGYAISARGFNGSASSAPNKLLVMIDGRSVYSPLFSGVFWDVQEVLLEDVERIEVVSGPGGTLWGLNAVNGVINIITRSSEQTEGSLLALDAGTDDARAAFRHGGRVGPHGSYRVHASHRRHRSTETAAGTAIDDAGRLSQAGFRADWDVGSDRLSLHGNVYDGLEEQPAPGSISVSGIDLVLGDIPLTGVNLTGRWRRELGDDSRIELQAYYDRSEREVPPTFAETIDIVDLQFQHSLPMFERHSLVWGGNLRYSHDRVTNSPTVAFLPAELEQKWISVFVQDDIRLSDAWRATLGTRFEYNDYTGTEVLPNLRLAWQAAPEHLLWAAASRAVRAPSRLDRDVFIPGEAPFLLRGGDPVRSEIAEVIELGWRSRPSARFSYSMTAFHAEYDHLRTQEVDPSGTFLVFASGMRGRISGIEAWANFHPTPGWRLAAGFTAQTQTLRLKPGSNDLAAPGNAGFDPSSTWQLRSSWTFGNDVELDVGLRHVGELVRDEVPAYTAVDLRLGWRPRPGLELSLIGRNLGEPHAEYRTAEFRSEFEPSVMARLVWSY